MRKYLYLCDHRFHIELLEPLYETMDKIGLMLITGNKTEFYHIRDKDATLVKCIRSHIQGKTSRGGQSQNRIQRLRDEAEACYVSIVAEKAREVFEGKVTDLILMGPANKKNLVCEKLYAGVKKMVKAVLTVSGTEKVETLVNLMYEVCESKKESPWVKRFLDDITLDGGKAVYGENEIKDDLKNAMLEAIIVEEKPSEELLEEAEAVGCVVVQTKNYKISSYGGVVGMRWFASSYEDLYPTEFEK